MNGSHKSIWILVFVALLAAGWFRLETMKDGPLIPQQVPPIVFITGGSGPYWQLTSLGAEAAAREHGVELQINMPSDDEDVGEQTRILVKLEADKLGGVAISPLNAESQTRLINSLAEQTNVVTFDSDARQTNRRYYVGTDNYSAGRLCATIVQEALPEGGKVAVLLANLTKSNLLDRKMGLEEGLPRTSTGEAADRTDQKFEIVDYLIDDGSRDKCARLISEALEKHPDLKCFVGMNTQHGPTLLKVLKKAGKMGQLTLVTFDEQEDTLKGIEDGYIYATIAQDPYMFGYESVRMLVRLYGGDEITMPIMGLGSVNVSATPIRKDNLEEFRKRFRDQLSGKHVDTSHKPDAG